MKNLILFISLFSSLTTYLQGEIGYHVTETGNLFKTVNSGSSWTNTFTGAVSMIDFVNENTGYHVTTSGNLFKTTDAGMNWTNTFTGTVQYIDFVNDSVGYHVTNSGNLFKTINSGTTWTNTFTSTVAMIDFVNESTGYHVTTSGNLFKTTDSGQTWSNTFTGAVEYIDFVTESTGYHITTGGNLFKTTDSGMNWSSTFTSLVLTMDFVTESIGYHVTSNGNLFKTIDSGANWSNTFTSTVAYIDFVTDTIIPNTTGIDVQTACDTFTWIDGNTYSNSNFTATHTLINMAGLDSVVTLNLTIIDVNSSVNQTGSTLTANPSGGSYQWLNCNGMTEIFGAINQYYSLSEDGDYAVVVTNNGCIDTSTCYSISNVSILTKDFENEIVLYPNPTDGNFFIDIGNYDQTVILTITDLSGKIIQTNTFYENQLINIMLDEPAGTYLLMIETDGKQALIQFINK